MDKRLASAIMAAAKALDRQLGELDTLLGQIPDGPEREQYGRALGDVIGAIAMGIIFRIERQYPDLNPDL